MNAETLAPQKPETAKGAIGARKIRFFLIDPHAEQVCVAGSFNNWNPTITPMTRENRGRWTKELMLRPGRYEYQFVINGHWKPDPAAKETVLNPFGGINSVLTVSAVNGNGNG